MKLPILVIMAAAFICNANAQNVIIPDANFKKILINDHRINSNGDDEIQISEAQLFADDIWCAGENISDLTGIEAFLLLTKLVCNGNLLVNLDVSKNINLLELRCYDNQLTSLDISKNTMLSTLSCSGNRLTSLDLSHNTLLDMLVCSENSLKSLDLSHNLKLTFLSCEKNKLTTLDVSKNTELSGLFCSDNILISLNIANGSNERIKEIKAGGNSGLTCIQVDNAAYSLKNWLKKYNFSFNNGVSFSNNCGYKRRD